MLAVHQLMLLCLTRRRATSSSDHILRSEVALLRTSPRPLYWPQCIYSRDSILLSRSVHEAVASGWFCFCHRRFFVRHRCAVELPTMLRRTGPLQTCHRSALVKQCRFTPCCNVLAMTMPQICSVGSHHAATCSPPE